MNHVTPPMVTHVEYLRTLKFYSDLIGHLTDTKSYDQWSNTDMVDTDFLLSRIEGLIEDVRKEISRRRHELAKVAGARWLIQALDDKSPIRGRLTSASPDCKENPVLPHPTKTPDEWKEVMEWLGITGEMAEFTTMRLNWPDMAKYANEKIENGEPIPECLRSKHVTFSLHHTPRKEASSGKSINLTDAEQITKLLRQ